LPRWQTLGSKALEADHVTTRNESDPGGPTVPKLTGQVEYAGAPWYARVLLPAGDVHWFYGPRLRPGIDKALAWCGIRENLAPSFVDAERIGAAPDGGVPCATCSRLAPLPGSVEQ
jgi:hypothetical protein